MCSNVLTAKSANGEGYETYLMGRLFHNFPSKALHTHTHVHISKVPTLTNVGFGQQPVCLNMAFGFNIDVKYLDTEPHWNGQILRSHYCKSRMPSLLI